MRSTRPTARGIDVVIIDTAGRLHTKANLMDELAKIRRTITKRLPEAQPEVLFVLDATTGQNGLLQAKAFHEVSGLTAIALTKLDSTSKGGVAFAIERQTGVPVLFVGLGETARATCATSTPTPSWRRSSRSTRSLSVLPTRPRRPASRRPPLDSHDDVRHPL